MKNILKLWTPLIATVILAVVCVGCGSSPQTGETGNEYFLKYEWPEKPKVGSYTLKVNLTDKAGKTVENADIAVSYDMPSMRGAHATTEIMKQNSKGDYLLPIHLVMPGDWEIIISAEKDGVEIAVELILLDI